MLSTFLLRFLSHCSMASGWYWMSQTSIGFVLHCAILFETQTETGWRSYLQSRREMQLDSQKLTNSPSLTVSERRFA